MSTLVDLLRRRAEERPDFRGYRFLRDGESAEDARTWGELDLRARAIGTALRSAGAAGTNVLMLFMPGLEFIEGYFGCLYAGAVPVPAYPPDPARLQRTLPRLQGIVADAGARFALTTKPLLALADMVFAQAPDLRALEWLATDGIDSALGERWARPAIGGDTLAMLQYTSGSTGTPRGVMLSHANLLANADCVFRAFELTPDDRPLSWLPIFHDMGFMAGILAPLNAGIPTIGMPPTAFLEKPFRWLAAIHATRATVSGGPNFAYDLCVRKTTPEQRAGLDLSCWTLAYNGAETVRADTIDRFASTFAASGFKRRAMFPCFGLAEATLINSGAGRFAEPIAKRFDRAGLEAGIVRESDADGAHTIVACGRPAHRQTIAIVDPETATRAAPDRVGEIWIAGPSVGHGYWRRPEESVAAFGARLADDDRAYLRTGDLGFVCDGELYVCGRAKDLIIIRGANHYPQDIELTVERAHKAIRPGCVAAFAVDRDDEEAIVVVAEVDRRYHSRDRRRLDRGGDRRTDPAQDPNAKIATPPRSAGDAEPLDVDQLFWIVRDAIGARHQLEAHAIVLVRAGSIHKTSSGKIQRRSCKQAFAAGELEVLADWRSDGTKQVSDVASSERPPRSKTPSSQPVRDAPAVVAAPSRPAVEIAALRNPSVLVVDSDLARRSVVVRALCDNYLTVVAADTADKAAQLVAAGTFAAAIGHELSLLTRIGDTSAHTARLLVTGFDELEAVHDAITNERVTGVISKKAGPQQILAAVSEAVAEWVGHHTDLAITATERWLAAWIANRLQINPNAIDLDAQVTGYGLDSLSVVEVQTALADWLQHPVPETLVRGKASIRSVARRLVSAGEASDRTSRQIPVIRDEVAIAIVGMGCAVPGARDVGALWRLIRDGVDAIVEVPEDRLRVTPATRWGGVVDGVTDFDAAFFGIAPRDAAHIDPQHRLLLETTWQALEDAGIAPQELAGTDTGVFVGISGSDFTRAQPELAISDVPSAAAHRLSYFFNLKGPSLAVGAGDASSIAALHLAVTSLQRGECNVAIAAGVGLPLTPAAQEAYAKARLLASDGRCKPLDAHADGSVLSDGCGVVVLKRLPDARGAANRVHAQILATAVRQNGRGHGLTAPNEAAQETVIREAVRRANVPPAQVRYAELTARGLPAVDAIEVRALASVLGADRPPEKPCVLGSLKANIGDTGAAGGVLGVIKAALVLEHDEMPRLLHLRELHREIALGAGIAAPMATLAWPEVERRIACVNSFGLLGTNGVAVLAGDVPPPRSAQAEYPAHVLCVSARSESALRVQADAYAARLAAAAPEELPDLCFTANLGRAHFAHRVAVTGASPSAMRDQMLAVARGHRRAIARGAAHIAFLFTGRGAAGPEMARQLFFVESRFRSVLQRCDRVVRDVLGRPLLSALYPTAGASGGWDAILDDPATVAVEYALADLWQSWGVYPDFVMGHDIGEYAAAVVAGALGLEDAVVLACERAKRLRRLDVPLAAAAVVAPEAKVMAALAAVDAPIALATHDGPRLFGVVGAHAAIKTLTKRLAADGIEVSARRDASPLHTPFVAPILDELATVAARIAARAPSIPLISNVTGKPYTGSLDADYWRRHTSEPVRFERGLRELVRQGSDVFLEVGPRPILAQASQDTLGPGSGMWLASLDPQFASDWEHMLVSLGALYERGVALNWNGFYHGQERRRVALPSYPFERKRCWPDG